MYFMVWYQREKVILICMVWYSILYRAKGILICIVKLYTNKDNFNLNEEKYLNVTNLLHTPS